MWPKTLLTRPHPSLTQPTPRGKKIIHPCWVQIFETHLFLFPFQPIGQPRPSFASEISKRKTHLTLASGASRSRERTNSLISGLRCFWVDGFSRSGAGAGAGIWRRRWLWICQTSHLSFSLFKGQRPSQKKVRWNPESELQKLDYLEKLEERAQGQENKDVKERKEGENEDEDENDGEEDIEEEPSDDDYFQNVKFDDDDDDDFNDVDDGGEA
ncbi:uncharacterized protein LOC122306619 [Carya illinoinensis]|uniref:uncharacterized protein LOC122306619 n=1 Tax=Carya illinoinensis TaxID=32201 RepID=UPI001C729B0F|nr:uncharacterized protein LOC122306619 [Carya illinoinensis]